MRSFCSRRILEVMRCFACYFIILFFFAENIREVNLIIEQGNTSSKVAVYKNGHIEASFVYKQFGVSVVAALFEKYAFTQGILSTVIDTDDELIAYLKISFSVLSFWMNM